MTTPIKRIRKEKVAVLHVCSEAKTLEQIIKTTDKLSLIIVGNGNPKDSYIYKVDEMGREIKGINEKLTGISGIVTELHEASVGKNAVDKTDKEKRTESRAIVQKWIQIFAFVVGAFGLILTAYFSMKGLQKQDVTQSKVDDLGVPTVVNKRGELVILPDSSRILYLFNDSMKYVIKRETK